MSTFQIGQKVEVRDTQWLIKNIEYDQDEALLTLESDWDEYGHFDMLRVFESLEIFLCE